jgi:hypothetical protein
MVDLDAAAVVQLHASRRTDVQLDDASAALGGSGLSWLGETVAGGNGRHAGARTVRCDLRLPLRAVGHEIEFRKAALVALGPVERQDGLLTLAISWRSATLAPLFPVFAGSLTVAHDGLTLDGWYAPPGGSLGMAVDRALLGMAARRTAAWFLGLIAAKVASAAASGDQQQHADGDDHQRP